MGGGIVDEARRGAIRQRGGDKTEAVVSKRARIWTQSGRARWVMQEREREREGEVLSRGAQAAAASGVGAATVSSAFLASTSLASSSAGASTGATTCAGQGGLVGASERERMTREPTHLLRLGHLSGFVSLGRRRRLLSLGRRFRRSSVELGLVDGRLNLGRLRGRGSGGLVGSSGSAGGGDDVLLLLLLLGRVEEANLARQAARELGKVALGRLVVRLGLCREVQLRRSATRASVAPRQMRGRRNGPPRQT